MSVQMAEVAIRRSLFAHMLGLIAAEMSKSAARYVRITCAP